MAISETIQELHVTRPDSRGVLIHFGTITSSSQAASSDPERNPQNNACEVWTFHANAEEAKQDALLEELSQQNINVTYEQKKGNLHANTRDINVGGVSVAFHGKLLIEETSVVINYGNRYGFIGPNGSGKVCV